MSSVVLIRAIVWCSPQLGHCETSSKRRRQYTQRKRPGSWVGRNQGSPQPGQAARRMIPSALPDSVIRSIIPFQAADEETGGAIAVGADLKAAAVDRRGKGRREGTEIVDGEGWNLAGVGGGTEFGETILVLAAGDRAGPGNEVATRAGRL